MTVAEQARQAVPAAAALEKVTVQEPDGIVEFTGTLIDKVSTRSGDQPRWTELRLYWADKRGYVLFNSGKSVLYHSSGAPCNAGMPRVVSDISDEEYDALIPHIVTVSPDDRGPCNPPSQDSLYDDDVIYVETDRNWVMRCAAAADVISALHQTRKVAGKVEQYLSWPADKLLHLAARKDTDIQAEITRKKLL